MKSFEVAENKAHISIDLKCYSEQTISKVLYWLGGDYTVSEYTENDIRHIMLKSKCPKCDWSKVKADISMKLVDFRMREQIAEQTKEVRTVLYLKAFANLKD